jgi:general L-amino acid transport system substrate-binding protein
MIRRLWLTLSLVLLAVPLAAPAHAQTMKEVRERGTLVCGVSQGLLGFSIADQSGQWSGFDVDFCRAVAAAVLGDPAKVRYVPLSASERFGALKERRVDLLSRNSTWTFEREAMQGLLFAGISYFDGQGFMVARTLNVTSALELDKTRVCAQAGTTSEANARDYFRTNAMNVTVVAHPTAADTLAAYASGACNVFTSDQSALYAERLKLPRPADHMIMPDVISKEPLGPVVRNDDVQWFAIVRWTLNALVNAEELGISRDTLDEALKSQKPDVRRFTGAEGGFGAGLGLAPDFAVAAVRAVGNYAEIYERHLGTQSRLAIPRGLNQLWSMGGILYVPPMR